MFFLGVIAVGGAIYSVNFQPHKDFTGFGLQVVRVFVAVLGARAIYGSMDPRRGWFR
jgi:hypothetical protein